MMCVPFGIEQTAQKMSRKVRELENPLGLV